MGGREVAMTNWAEAALDASCLTRANTDVLCGVQQLLTKGTAMSETLGFFGGDF